METVNESMNRSAMVVNVLINKFPKFKKLQEQITTIKNTQTEAIYKNFIGAKIFKISVEQDNMIENGYNNSSKNHNSFIDEQGDLHFEIYESIYKTEIVFAKDDEKGMALYNAYFAMITVPSRESAKMFKEALEAY